VTDCRDSPVMPVAGQTVTCSTSVKSRGTGAIPQGMTLRGGSYNDAHGGVRLAYSSTATVSKEKTMKRLAIALLVVAMAGPVFPALAFKPEHVKQLKDTKKCKKCDLTSADLRNQDFDGADMGEADLTGADLSNTSLLNASFEKAKLKGANLTGANLMGVKLKGADLTDVNLDGAFISESDVRILGK
jgi:uncharacterized protein YjbI with pentapeptide repeats